MEIITNPTRESKYNQITAFYPPSEVLIFDIETTGFSADTTTLYLIGCCYLEHDVWQIRQYFNDDGTSEEEILDEFLQFASGYKYLLHYNGDGFDLPYLEKKLSATNRENTLSKLESIDIYKQLKPLKKPLHLDTLKQKSVEQFLGVSRLDKYTGGDLIRVYQRYLKKPTEKDKKLLLQHNYEDLEGLKDCCSLLSYVRFFAGCFSVCGMSVRREHLLFSLKLDYALPKRITTGIHEIRITGYQTEGTIQVPILSEELKFFFDNYREYYYLPTEDRAVHKSVAAYVDKNYREQAKKETCYLKKKGYFISQIDGGILTGYKRAVKDKETFIELCDSFLKDIDLLNAYARHIIKLAR